MTDSRTSNGAPGAAEVARALGPMDRHLFNEGTHSRLYENLGAHVVEGGVRFGVWAPDAASVSVVGDWNGWDREANHLRGSDAGVWDGVVPDAAPGSVYKYHVTSRHGGYRVDKADPYAFRTEVPPRTASIVWDLAYDWGDDGWMTSRGARNALDAPMSVYEVHLGSWRRVPEEGDRHLRYRELAPLLADHCERLGFTHVEFLPVMEHPFYGSWGYQTTGYFAPSARYGEPQDLMFLIDHLHGRGIGVILDWVPSHFPSDEHGLGYFDGTHLYEHQDPRLGFHPDWNSLIFNYRRNEVRSFLLSSARFWLDRYHADGLRVDAVASMLYLDYSRKEGEWIANEHGGRENLDAIGFLRQLNETLYRDEPGIQTTAEESTAWPMVSRPTYLGGLGFGLKWDMGWMHDTLDYIEKDPVHRRYHHDRLTFRMVYAWNENFVLPLSHDEVVHGKGSLVGKMPGDDWQKIANLRLLYAYMWAQPGKKLLFMGAELAQWREWAHDSSLDWHLLDDPRHRGVSDLLADLNRLLREEPALHRLDFDPRGFQWLEGGDHERSLLTFLRRGDTGRPLVCAFNFTPVPRHSVRVGLPAAGAWSEILNTDARQYCGSGQGNMGAVQAAPAPASGQPWSAAITVPPLGGVFLAPAG